MMSLRIIFMSVLVFSVAGCGTGYKKGGFTGGYDEEKVSDTVFWLRYSGNGFTNKSTVLDFWNRRAKELCNSEDYEENASVKYANNGESHPIAKGYVYCNSLISDSRRTEPDSLFQKYQGLPRRGKEAGIAGLDELRDGKLKKLNAFYSKLLVDYSSDASLEQYVYSSFRVFNALDISEAENLNQWVKQYPNSQPAFLARGIFYLSQAWVARGHGYSNQVSEDSVRSMKTYLGLAENDLKNAASITPRVDIPYYYLFKVLQLLSSRSADAEKYINIAREINPQGYKTVEALLGNARPEWGGSITEMEALIESIKPSENASSLNGYVSYYRGESLLRNGRYRDAVVFFNSALTNGDNANYYFSRGDAKKGLKDYEGALADYDKAAELNPYFIALQLRRADMLDRQGRYEESLKLLDYALKLNPHHVGALGDRGLLTYRLRLYGDAKLDFEQMIQQGANYPWVVHAYKKTLFQINVRNVSPVL